MRQLGIIVLLFLGILNVDAQEEKKIDVKLYGFIRNDAFVDTYKGLNAANEQFYLYPLYVGMDEDGNHINEQISSNIVAMATRFGIKISGPDLFNATTSAVIETDFAGNPSTLTALLRLRQGHVKLDWEKSTLLIGQTWHPFWTGSVFPTVGSLNTGAPFQPFNRSPQVRYDYNLGKVALNASAVYEFQYVSNGPSGKSDQYGRNSGLPEFIGGLEAKFGELTLGAAASLKHIKPSLTNTVTINVEGSDETIAKTYVSDDLLQSVSFVGYAQFKAGMLTLNAKSVYGQNIGYLLMPSGYGVSAYSAVNKGATEYTNYNNSYSYINAVYGKKWQLGFFAGYGLNLGTSKSLISESQVWGMSTNIQSMYRLAPHIAHNAGKARFVLEYENMGVEYGDKGTFNTMDGLYGSSTGVTNNRLLITMMYFF